MRKVNKKSNDKNTKKRTAIKRNTKKRTTIKRNKRNTKKRGLKKRGGTKRYHEDEDEEEDNKLQRVDDEDEDEDDINVADELQKRIDAIEIESLPPLRSYPANTAEDIIDILNYDGEAQIFEYDGQEQDYKALLHKKLLQELLEMYNNPPRWTPNQTHHERNLAEYDKEMLEIVELLKKYEYTLDNKLITGIIPSLLY